MGVSECKAERSDESTTKLHQEIISRRWEEIRHSWQN